MAFEMIQELHGIAPKPPYKPEKPERNPAYLRFIRRFPCIGCGITRGIEAMHSGAHGIGQKASDKSCLPGCHQCHREYDKNPRWFLEKRQLDRLELVTMFNRMYELKTGKTVTGPPAEPENRAA